jgi:choloylglycine hydrolase
LRTSPRGRQYSFQSTAGKASSHWAAKYGYLYLDAMQQDVAVDGMNEAGLSFEALYLPGETQYQRLPQDRDSVGVPYYAFGDWVLSQFESVEEVRAALDGIIVFEEMLPGFNGMIFPLHFAVYDATGKGIVIEFVNGQRKVYDNQIGVMTNSPQYDWQVTNLRNYVNFSPVNPTPTVQGGITFAATGQGAGMLGMPGDYTPPSRFVKVAKLLQFVDPAADALSAVNIAQHVMNNVDIASGTVVANDRGTLSKEYTQWVVFKDLTHKTLYYRTYNNLTLRMVSFQGLDFSENAPRLKMAIEVPEAAVSMQELFLGTR